MILQAKNIVYSYKPKQGINVLKNVSMDFEKGKIYALLGASGSGKSTFLSLLAGLDMPVSGEIIYKGSALIKNQLSQYRKNAVSLVFQNYNLIDYLTPVENVKLGGPKDAKSLLEQVHIAAAEQNRNVLQLSGGQQQRVAIARALALHPDILCFDEPTSALDPELTGEVMRVIESLKADGTTMIIVTHEIEFAANVSDHIIFMSDGVIEEEGSPEEIIRNPKKNKTRAFLQKLDA